MSKNVVNNTADGMRLQPQLTKSEAFKAFLYDADTGAVMGRTGAGWIKLLIFYIIFYIILTAIAALSFWLFTLTISEDHPKYYLDDSLIGTSPGLGYRPMSNYSEESSLIWYNISSETSHRNWTDGLDKFLKEYENHTKAKNVIDCDYDNRPGKGQVCAVDVENWDPCTSANKYDYLNNKPCIFIKLNKILKWEPDYFKDAKDLPKKMPYELKKHIEDIAKTDPKLLNTVWVTCEGENPADKEFIGHVEYMPYQGFAGYYYPFLGVKNYRSPLVAVHFLNLTRNVLVNVECKAWAHNIEHDRRDRVGLVHFELLID